MAKTMYALQNSAKLDRGTHLSFLRRGVLGELVVEGELLVGVVVHVLHQVVGEIEGPEVVVGKLEVDEHELVLADFGLGRRGLILVVLEENVSALDVVVTEDDRGVDAGEKLPGTRNSIKPLNKFA